MTARRATPRDFESEAHLCEVFAEKARAAGFEVWPEVAEWDLLLVVPGHFRSFLSGKDGTVQIGVEAKLRGSLEAVNQAYRRMVTSPQRPTVAAVLVPQVTDALRTICSGLSMAAWAPSTWRASDAVASPIFSGEHEPLELPRFDVPHLRAGAPSPRPLTAWREAAIRLCIRLRDRGCVTTLDFRELGLSKRWWTGPGGPLAPAGYVGRHAAYQARAGAKLPDEGWEGVAQQIRDREAA